MPIRKLVCPVQVAVVVGVLELSGAGRAQTLPPPPTGASVPVATFADIAAGSVAPLALKVKELGAGWLEVKLSSSSGSDSWMQAISGAMGGTAGADRYFTKGQMVSIGGEAFLLVYHHVTNSSPMAAMMVMQQGKPPAAEPFTAGTTLSLNLYAVKSLAGVNDIVPFDLDAEIAAQAKAAETAAAAWKMMHGGAQAADASISQLKQIGLAFAQYGTDHDRIMPPMKDATALKAALEPYLHDASLFTDPADDTPFQFVGAMAGQAFDNFTPQDMVAYSKGVDANGRHAVLYADWHAVRVDKDEWARLKQKAGLP